jgi:Tfp pilus assembly PilM family ATPase
VPESERILGVSISGGGVQAVELERSGASTTLLAIDEWDNAFLGSASSGPAEAREFASRLAKFRSDNRSQTTRVSLAIDTANLFLNSLPISEGLTRNEINDHVKWELAQYFPDTDPNEFITDVHVLTERVSGPFNEALSVSLRRDDAAAFKKAIVSMGLELHIVDADHFAADTALRVNYPDTYRKYIALAGIKENRIDISLVRNGSLESYRYVIVNSNQDIIQAIASLARRSPGIHSITAYGPYLDRDLLTQIRRGSPILVEALNPFRHVDVADSLRLADNLSVPSYRFAAAVGVALRRD